MNLTNLAYVANIFAWIILVVEILYLVDQFFQYQSLTYLRDNTLAGISGDLTFAESLRQNPLMVFRLSVKLVKILVQGVVYWLILKGISAGLYMVVETELNYREKFGDGSQDDSTDSSPEFYNPDRVLRLEKWMNRAALISLAAAFVYSLSEINTIGLIVTYSYGYEKGWNFEAWLIAAGLYFSSLLLTCLINFFPLKALAYILKIIMQMEFNSRGRKPDAP